MSDQTKSKLLTGLLVFSLLVAVSAPATAQEDSLQYGEELYLFEPDTPARLVRAAIVAVQLDRIRLARQYLQSVVEQELTSEQRVALRRELGTQPFLMLNANRALEPYAGQLLDQINRAASESQRPDSDAPDLIGQLASDSRAQAVQAAADLIAMGDAAVPALLEADMDTAAGRIAAELLQRHRRARRFGLLKALPAADAAQQERILYLLRGTSDHSVAQRLLPYEFGPYTPSIQRAAAAAIDDVWRGDDRPANRNQAALLLNGRATELLRESVDPFMPVSSEERLERAVVFADAAFEIAPEQDAIVAVRNVALLAAHRENAEGLNESERDAALDVALDVENGTAVLALLTDDLDRLNRAMLLPDPTVRVAAAERVLRMNRPVRGCDLAKEILRSAANGSQRTEAVVIDSRDELGQTAFILGDPEGPFQYEVAPAATGQDGFEAAASQLQTELILVHSNCLYWDLTPTIANLRSDYRTRNVPIVIYGPDRVAARITLLQLRYRGLWFVEEPIAADNVASELTFQNVPGPRLSAEVRDTLIETAREVLDAYEKDHSAFSGDGVIWYGATSVNRRGRQ